MAQHMSTTHLWICLLWCKASHHLDRTSCLQTDLWTLKCTWLCNRSLWASQLRCCSHRLAFQMRSHVQCMHSTSISCHFLCSCRCPISLLQWTCLLGLECHQLYWCCCFFLSSTFAAAVEVAAFFVAFFISLFLYFCIKTRFCASNLIYYTKTNEVAF